MLRFLVILAAFRFIIFVVAQNVRVRLRNGEWGRSTVSRKCAQKGARRPRACRFPFSGSVQGLVIFVFGTITFFSH